MMGWALLLAALSAHAQIGVPPVARVIDQTGALNAAQQQGLVQKLAAFEANKGSQIAVLIVPTTAPETIEQYGIRVAEAWKLGRKGVDDGALLLVALQDRAVRIEVGYGLEGALPDAIAKRIIEEAILPRFREGDLPGGITTGVDRMIAVVDGEPLPDPPADVQDEGEGDSPWPLLLFGVLLFGQSLRRALGAAPAALLLGGGVFLAAWWIVGAWVPAAVVGFVAFIFTLVGLGGGTRFGSGMGGSSHSGGFGGGGFSGGGGGFGGGGASGRW